MYLVPHIPPQSSLPIEQLANDLADQFLDGLGTVIWLDSINQAEARLAIKAWARLFLQNGRPLSQPPDPDWLGEDLEEAVACGLYEEEIPC